MKLPMKLLRTAGLCLVAMFAMSMVAAVSASAEVPAWEHCETEKSTGTVTKYTEHQCLTTSGTGTWAWKEVKGTEKVVSHGSLVLRDTSATVGKIKVAVSCSGENKGSVGPGKYGRITEIPETSIQCSNVENCTVFKKAEARNLPWQTELVEEAGGEIRNKITNGGAAEAEWPGWAVTCELAGAETTDRCTTNSGSTAIANQTTHGSSGTELLVLATFEAKTAKAKCSLSSTASKETGEVRGTIANLQANGWGLRIS